MSERRTHRRLNRLFEGAAGYDPYQRPHDTPTLHPVSYLLAPHDPPSEPITPEGRRAA